MGFSHVPFLLCTINEVLGIGYLLPLAQPGVSWMENSWPAQAMCLLVFTIASAPDSILETGGQMCVFVFMRTTEH